MWTCLMAGGTIYLEYGGKRLGTGHTFAVPSDCQWGRICDRDAVGYDKQGGWRAEMETEKKNH